MNLAVNFFLLLIFLTILSCGQKSPEKESTPSSEQSGTTEKMVERIREIHKDVDPVNVSYLSSERARKYDQMAASSRDLNEQFRLRLMYAYESINAGDNDRAVLVLEQMLNQFRERGVSPEVSHPVKRLAALAYMRLGEVENCILRNSDESCIFPIMEGGEYTVRRGVEAAIRIYNEMLELKPDDAETIWMLNFAYMTLGQYPEEVPDRFLLPEKAFASAYDVPRFPNVATELGVNTLGLSGGVCLEDFNRDGKLDIFASSWDLREPVRLFFQKGDGSFEDVTQQSGLAEMPGGLNMIQADYNNDSWVDILILRGAWLGTSGGFPNSLLRNNGDGTFTDVTEEAGLLSYHPTQAAVWDDFNQDGWLDLFIANESVGASLNPCEFYISNGDGTFSNKINQARISNLRGFYKGVTSGDINNDGRPDLYISNFRGNNQLLLNEKEIDGIPLFKNITEEAGVGEPFNSFPTWMWDYNHDGLLDIFVAAYELQQQSEVARFATLNARGDWLGGQPHIYKNLGDNRFQEMSRKMGLEEAVFAMGANFGDIDNDGYPDVYLGTGDPSFTSIVPNKMYRNAKGEEFQDVTTASGLGHIQKGHAVAFGDLDNDGDQDIFCVLGGAYEGDPFADALFQNPFGNEKSWLTLRLRGKTANRDAIGARIQLTTKNKNGSESSYYAVVSTGGSFGASSLQQELGLGDAIRVKQLKITWPNQKQTVDVYEDIAVNQVLEIEEGNSELVN
jgi:hypothetical protein